MSTFGLLALLAVAHVGLTDGLRHVLRTAPMGLRVSCTAVSMKAANTDHLRESVSVGKRLAAFAIRTGFDLAIPAIFLVDRLRFGKTSDEDERLAQKNLKTLKELAARIDDATDNTPDEIGYGTYPNHPEFPDYDLSKMMKMVTFPNDTPTLEFWWGPRKTVRAIWRALNSVLATRASRGDSSDTSRFNSPYHRVLSTPGVAIGHRWLGDKEFARQFIAGVNPVLIERVKSLDAIPGRRLVSELGDGELSKLVKQRNLYMVNYGDMAELKKMAAPWAGRGGLPGGAKTEDEDQDHWLETYMKAPIVLLTVPEGQEHLMPLAIQLERTDDAPVLTTASGDAWILAKCFVQNADAQMHEWVSHLGRSHLTIEPHIGAIHNQLVVPGHKLASFLFPHVKETLFLNWLARKTLVAYPNWDEGKVSGAISDTSFSIGTAQALQLIDKYWQRYEFFDYAFDKEFAARGFDVDGSDPLKDYYFLNDGRLVWKALGEYATDFVNSEYENDAAVAADTQLQAWAQETADPNKAAIKGFPSAITDKETLARCCQIVMWTASGYHAAVNYPQYDFYHLQNKPTIMRKDFDTKSSPIEWYDHVQPLMPTINGIVSTVYTLVLPSERCLLDSSLLAQEAKKGDFEAVFNRFQDRVRVISDGIAERNAELEAAGEVPYSYLDPKNVPASIDI